MTDPEGQAQQAQLAKSAHVITASAVTQADSADRRTELAMDRTVLAAERTYAAWVRTGLAALASGIGARALLDGVVPGWLALTASATLVLFSSFCFVAAVWREMRPRYRQPKPDARRLPPLALITINGILILVSIAAFVGVFAAK